MSWLEWLVTPKIVQDTLDEQTRQHDQLKANIENYQRGLLEAEHLLRGEKADAESIA